MVGTNQLMTEILLRFQMDGRTKLACVRYSNK